ncbi:TonB family protein [Roseibium sp. RKSG952]|uniref:TonB family protein n=1 Tax=Roseibium sp. RKSG952 TaxID=2529384 RepID=UPI0012BC4446|nr:TonB family protein [Roseibium sp. RKSG952]MTI02909.1 TonB family protein [Roseibium sp. RKSG952]
MIPSSRTAAIIAVLLALATHSVALHDFSAKEEIQIEGGGSVEVAALGSSFEDYTAGTAAAAEVTKQHTAETPEQSKPVDPSKQVTEPETAAAVSPAPAAASATPVVAVQKPATQQQAMKPVEQAETKAVPEQSKVKKTEPEPEAKSQVAAQQGNSKNNAKKGSEAGETSKGAANAQKAKVNSAKQGNAEASNYAGLVKRAIMRARRKSVNIRGAALVSFRIADNGSLLSASISRSSGSKRLDQVALAQVKAAAPFPPPPPSARRDFTIKIVGK